MTLVPSPPTIVRILAMCDCLAVDGAAGEQLSPLYGGFSQSGTGRH
jgi:hypothetical protein